MANTDENIFPVYIQIREEVGSKTDILLKELNGQRAEFEVEDVVEISSIIKNDNNENLITIEVNTFPTDSANLINTKILHFVNNLFKVYNLKYPSYVVPVE